MVISLKKGILIETFKLTKEGIIEKKAGHEKSTLHKQHFISYVC